MALRLLYNNLLRVGSFLRTIYIYTLLVYTQCLVKHSTQDQLCSVHTSNGSYQQS